MLFRRSRREREAVEQPFPDAWRTRLGVRWAHWPTLDPAERSALEDLTKRFLARVRFEAAHGFAVTDEMRLLVAAQASFLVMGMNDPTLDLYSRLTSVILHPRTVVLRGTHHVGDRLVSDSAQTLSGQAHHRGPVVLSWSTVAFEARHPDRGQNVVLHEFAHQLDMFDGTIDGTPPIDDPDLRDRFIRICTSEYRRVRRGDDTVLRSYAATDTGEFFAVATETFFSVPERLELASPELYAVLREVYGQDPAERARRRAR